MTALLPASQTGRRRFDPGLPLQQINNLAKPVPPCTPLHSISELTPIFRAGSLRLSDPPTRTALDVLVHIQRVPKLIGR